MIIISALRSGSFGFDSSYVMYADIILHFLKHLWINSWSIIKTGQETSSFIINLQLGFV